MPRKHKHCKTCVVSDCRTCRRHIGLVCLSPWCYGHHRKYPSLNYLLVSYNVQMFHIVTFEYGNQKQSLTLRLVLNKQTPTSFSIPWLDCLSSLPPIPPHSPSLYLTTPIRVYRSAPSPANWTSIRITSEAFRSVSFWHAWSWQSI